MSLLWIFKVPWKTPKMSTKTFWPFQGVLKSLLLYYVDLFTKYDIQNHVPLYLKIAAGSLETQYFKKLIGNSKWWHSLTFWLPIWNYESLFQFLIESDCDYYQQSILKVVYLLACSSILHRMINYGFSII